MGRSRWLPVLFVVAACASDGGTLSGPVALDSIEASAAAQVVSTADSERSLVASVALHNRSSFRIEFVVGTYCPVVVRLYDPDSPDAGPVYDGGDPPCPRAGRIVKIAPGESGTLEGSVRLQRLRDAGVAAGQYRVVAVVTSSPLIEVDAGTVEIP